MRFVSGNFIEKLFCPSQSRKNEHELDVVHEEKKIENANEVEGSDINVYAMNEAFIETHDICSLCEFQCKKIVQEFIR